MSYLVETNRCKLDNTTIKNIILLALLTAMQIGELGALNYTKNIDWNNNCIRFDTTLSKDENQKVIIGTNTKTGKKKIKKNQNDEIEVPFDIFNKNLFISILNEQIKVAKNNKYNKNHLLFCSKDGSFIHHTSLTNIFKKICRDASIKTNLAKGCHIHMCRHTAITRMIESGMDLMVIAKIVGHVDTKQIERTYGHILQQFQKEQLELSRNHYANNNLFTLQMKNTLIKKQS